MHRFELPPGNSIAIGRTTMIGLIVVLSSSSVGCHGENDRRVFASVERTFAEQLAEVRAGRSDRIVILKGSVRDDDLMTLGDVPNLVHLELPQAAASDRGLAGLCGSVGLRVLVLGKTTTTNDGLAMIAKLMELRRVNLANTDADDAGLALLATLPHLESLRIGGPGLTDAGLAGLARAESLRFLILRNAPISDDGLKHLAPLAQLESLYLEGTQVTAAGERYLAAARPDLHVHFP